MVIRWLRSWQLMAVIAIVGVGVAVVAAVAEASAHVDVPTAGDGFGDAPELASAGEGDDAPAAPSDPVVADLWLNDWLEETASPTRSAAPTTSDGPAAQGPEDAGSDAAEIASGVAEGAASAAGSRGDVTEDTRTDDAGVTADARTADATGADATTRNPSTNADAPGMRPSAVRIPAIAVDAPTIPLGLRANGEIEVPEDPDDTGWWADGPAPGTPGPTVLLGHVNDWSGPAVFNNLHTLGRGDEIHVDRADGTTVVYAVTAASLHDKNAFPTDAVYRARSDTSLLRLVTCGGVLDRQSGSYDSNYVVFAEQIRIEEPPGQAIPL